MLVLKRMIFLACDALNRCMYPSRNKCHKRVFSSHTLLRLRRRHYGLMIWGPLGARGPGAQWSRCRERNKEKFLHVRRTCDHVRLTCPPIFSHVQKIMHRSTQNHKFRKTGTILNYFKIQQIVGRCCFM